MSVASRIQEIETHIGDIYDTLEVGGTDLTDLNKNIVNINSSLKDRYKYFLNNGVEIIWNNWEKVIGEGTEFTLENTIQAPMKINLKGNTYQKSTTGKNLFDVPSVYSFEGNKSKNITLSAGTYYINCGNITKGGENGPFIVIPNVGGIALTQNLNRSFTLSSEITSVSFYSNGWDWSASQGITSTVENLMISTSGGDYEPYTGKNPSPSPDFPQDIQVVSGENTIMIANEDSSESQNYTIDLGDIELCKIGDYQDKIDKSTGKNLVEETLEHSNLNSSGTIVGGSSEVYDLHIAKVIEGENYTLTTQESGADIVLGFFNTKPIMSSQTYNQERVITRNTTFTAPITGYVAFRSVTGYSTPMLNEGQTALPYEPYGTGWYLNKQIGKVVLNGSENWQTIDNRNTGDTFYASTAAIDLSRKADALDLICNNFKKLTDLWSNFNTEGTQIYDLSYNLRFRILKTALSEVTLDSFKTWLSNNNTIVYYVLATPITTEITDTTLISQLEAIKYSYDEQTNISQVNNDMPFKLEVTALKNI